MATDRTRSPKTDQRTAIFAANLQAALASRQLQQADLARGTDLSRDAINRYVNSITFPPLAKIAAIAAALGLQARDLDPEFPENPKFWKSAPAGVLSGFSIQSAKRAGLVRFVADVEISSVLAAEIVALLSKADV
jgi:transcriptional regulator with XRE-family HTH domain